MGMKVKMRSALVLLLILTLFGGINSNPDRERNKHSSSANFDLMDHGFHHDLHEDPDDHYSSHHDDSHSHPQGNCEPIKVGLCMGIGYNQTTMPNLIGHDSQADAEALLQTFNPLIQYGCSSNLKLFLCSAHVPMCTDKIPQPIGPCRSLCESVRSKCAPVLKEFGFEWPESLTCSKFHQENNHDNLCNPGPQDYYRGSSLAPKRERERDPPTSTQKERFPPTIYGGESHPSVPVIRQNPGGINVNIPPHYNPSSPSVPSNNPKTFNTDRNPFKTFEERDCLGPRKVWTKGTCYLKCSAASTLDDTIGSNGAGISLFHSSEKSFARNYALLWAVLSLSAAFIALTLSVCSPRFSVAERPILYLALCQVLYSVGVIIGSTSSVSCFVDKVTGSNLLARGGMIPSSCAFVFLLTYFFGIATSMWWVILCLSWLLSLNRNVASSLLQKESSLFHLITWGISSVLTSTALVHKKVDADELTGICGVGFQDTEALFLYNLIPLIVCLSFGIVCLTFGIIVRVFFPEWNLPVCKLKFLKRKIPTEQNRNAGCELSNNSAATTTASHQTGQTHTHLQNSFRGHHGYSPVLVGHPPPPPTTHPPHGNYHGYSNCHMDRHHNHGHFVPSSNQCMCSGPCGGGGVVVGNNNNGLLYSTGNSPASVIGVGGFQRLRALENTKAIWMRIGIFALVHSLPIACQVGTIVYELSGREDWERGKEKPNLQIFLLRLNMNLIAGLTTGVWVLSTYSWKSLLTIIRKLCKCLQVPRSKTKKTLPHEQKLPVPNSVVAPLLTTNNVPVPSSSSCSSNNHASTMHMLDAHNNTFTTRGALAPHNISSAAIIPRYNHPLPPVPPRNPDHIAFAQQQQQHQRTDAWRRGETIV